MLDLELKKRFHKDGYIVAENILPRSFVEEIQQELQTIAKVEKSDESFIIDGVYLGEDWFTCIPNYPSFKQLLEYQPLINTIEHLLSSRCELALWFLTKTSPNKIASMWHQDLNLLPVNPKVVVTFSFHPLDTVEPFLKIIPESQNWQDSKIKQIYQEFPGEVVPNISSQAAILHDPMLWHANYNSSNKANFLFYLIYSIYQPPLNQTRSS